MSEPNDKDLDTPAVTAADNTDHSAARKMGRLLRKVPLFHPFFAERDGFRETIAVLRGKLRFLDRQYRADITRLASERERYTTAFAPGHFYSSVPGLAEIRSREAEIFDRVPDRIPGVDLNETGQLQFLSALSEFYRDLPFTPERQPGLRYYFENRNFSYADAIAFYSMIRHAKPRRIVEVGCGFSSCVALDTNERFFSNAIEMTFVDPFPQLLQALMFPGDAGRTRIIQDYVQDVPLRTFNQLEANDILFVDSSHVLRTAGDLNHILFQVLPYLKPGVYVHFHDITFPFEYPKEWVFESRAWNECYALRAFLQHNNAYQILYFNSFLMRSHRQFFEERMPLCLKNPGGSLWLRKTGTAVTPEPEPVPARAFQPTTRFDAVRIAHPQQLGRGWYGCDGDMGAHWMGKSAELVLKGPERPGMKLRLAGFLPNPSGASVTLSSDGTSIGVSRLTQGTFRLSFALPDKLVGRERFVLKLELDKTYYEQRDDRELGLSFGIIEIV
jgi:hypothetical protein